ncbi:IS66 family insertion sequence element accessory protein TnpB [Pseudomonas oryzihabitans]|uniref:IS66 family insertion sequence element accessory protein TnpB n=1 Tax=Pseudomonas oryzihabitans TaxID=47885 RepID=UPI003633AAAC
MDMLYDTETALARVVSVFGAAKPHCAYIFANRRAYRTIILMHDGVGIWLAAPRLNQKKFHWQDIRRGAELHKLSAPGAGTGSESVRTSQLLRSNNYF